MSGESLLDLKVNGDMDDNDAKYSTDYDATSESISCSSVVETSIDRTISDASVEFIRKKFESDKYLLKSESSGSISGSDLAKSHGFTSGKTSDDLIDSRRKFRILGLKFPGQWVMNENFWSLLENSESFYVWFDKTAGGGVKHGELCAAYETQEDAIHAITAFSEMSFDVVPISLLASKPFYDSVPCSRTDHPPTPFDINPSDADGSRRLYALHLSSSADETLLASIFGSESIESVRIEVDPFTLYEKQAEIVFRSEEEADDAIAELGDGFEIDEGDRQITMKLMKVNEYATYMKAEYDKFLSAYIVPPSIPFERSSSSSKPSSSVSSTAIASVSETAVAPFVLAPEITVEDVTGFMQQYVDDSRTNWAELNEADDLWKLCDEISKSRKGIPDSLLKAALLNVLERHQLTVESEWMKHHVDVLIRKWKKEMLNMKSAQRSTSYTMCAATYVPHNSVPPKNSMSSAKKRALATMMGVGKVLNKVRTMLATEEGELDVDEDEHGNYTIDGQPLSFESWADINKPVEPAPIHDRSKSYIDPKLRKLRSQKKKEGRRKKMEEEKLKKMTDAKKECEQYQGSVSGEESAGAETVTPEIRELEEGEMSDSSSSASTSSDEDIDEITSRRRRRKRRIQEQISYFHPVQTAVGSVNPQFTALFTQLYEHRHLLCRMLVSSHKTAFASVLGQILSSPHGMTSAQQNQINLFIQNFSAQSLP
ncbi:unnamed protein product [Thelazia callipaeda]|uniref:RRM domain-containing protein n=1 Tax=Thelazia callipaeda TaxID=103827 RepID=A0A0N5D188_THECL|nr:unnamed protein product [Thelazia callipaeda]